MAASSDERKEKDLESQDLAPVLKRLTQHAFRARPAARRELANSRMTRELLDAGLRLIAHEFQGERADEEERSRPFLGWISQQRVTKEAATAAGTKVSLGQIRDRWPRHDDYLEDLLSYALWSQWQGHANVADSALGNTGQSADLPSMVHAVSYGYLNHWINDPINRLSFIILATADRDPAAHEAAQEIYKGVHASWKPLYKAVLDLYGLQLRPGVTLDEATDLIAALAEGIGIRIMAGADENFLGHRDQRSLLGKGIMAVMIAYIDPGDGKSLDDVLRALTD